MALAKKLEQFIEQHDVEYDTVLHPHTGSSMETAEAAHVPGDCLAKGVVVKDEEGFLLVVIPSDYHVELNALEKLLNRKFELASEAELVDLFPDCEAGAIPPLGEAYAIDTWWDPVLGDKEVVYFEAGDHDTLVRLSGEHFHELMTAAERGHFSHHI
jgi:Ala-tRNA(Pro) deacylase